MELPDNSGEAMELSTLEDLALAGSLESALEAAPPSTAVRPRLRRASSVQQSPAGDGVSMALNSPRSVARAMPLPVATPSTASTAAALLARTVAQSPLRRASEAVPLPSAPELARKVQSQAAELLRLTQLAGDANAYVHVLERRLLELAPGHPMPVGDEHFGTPVASVSTLVTAALRGAQSTSATGARCVCAGG